MIRGISFTHPFTRFLKLPSPYRIIALILALNYFAFQVELFDEEYEANHPKKYETASLTSPSLNWESFDKNNAPQAFVFDAGIRSEFLFELPAPVVRKYTPVVFFTLVRDKSPPLSSIEITQHLLQAPAGA